jgi:Pyruvate/2-oxoacid:ferredoxin oxidoreductase gamma subunit
VSMFSKATKTKAKLRLALAGPAGSGKTYTALALASIIADGGKIAVIDTENGSASKYADLFSFDAADLTVGTGFSPERYLELLHAAEDEGLRRHRDRLTLSRVGRARMASSRPSTRRPRA